MSKRPAFERRLSSLFLLLLPALLHAQTPTISSIQSGFGTANHGNAVTAGAAAPSGNGNDLLLFINGNFNDADYYNYEDVTWTENGQVTDLGNLSESTTQVIANVPSYLYAPNGSTSQRTITITVTEYTDSCDSESAFSRLRPRQSGCSFATINYYINPPLANVSNPMPSGEVGVAYSQNFFTGGTPPYSTSLSQAPSGLSATTSGNPPSTGNPLAGTPTQYGSLPLAGTVTDAWANNPSTSQYTSLTVSNQVPIIAGPTITGPASLPPGVQNQTYTSTTIQASGGTGGYTWALTNGPPGLTINSSGVISGTPTASGTYMNVQVTVMDSAGASYSAYYTIQIDSPLRITTTSPLPTGVQGQSYSTTISTNGGGVTPYTWSATGLPTGLSINSSSGVISGTPSQSGSFQVTVTVVDSGGSAQQTQQVIYALQINSALTITTTSPLPAAAQGQSYSTTISTNGGGVTPYTWSATGLPTGLSINSSSGVISGTPTQSGAFQVNVTVRDSGGAAQQTQQATLALQVNSGLTITTTSPLPPAAQGQSYSTTISTNGGGVTPYTWSATGLPTGLSINSSSGVISGTPTQSGAFQVNVTVRDSGGAAQQTQQATFALQVNSSLTITTTSPLPTGAQGQSYSTTITTNGGGVTPYTWSATGLPTGLSINSSSGVISGTPTQSGPFEVTVTVRDSGGSAQQTQQANFALQVNSALTITTTSPLPAAAQGQSYTTTIATNGGGVTPYTWSATGLPTGLSINSSSGVISGTPTQSGSFQVIVTVRDSGGAAQQTKQGTFALQVNSGLTITTTSPLPTAAQGQSYSTTIATNGGGVTPYTWSATGLPTGLAINSSSGVISGTPTQSGAFQVMVTVRDSGGSAQQTQQATFALQVNSALLITTTSLPSAAQGQSYSTTLATNGGGVTPYTWSATGLPSGLSINSSTGVISGTPTQSGPFQVTVTVRDSGGVAQQTKQATFALQVNSGLAITTASLPPGVIGQSYSTTVATNGGGVTPYTWSQTGLPGGLSISSSTGVISGTPTQSGSFQVTVTVRDSGGSAQQTQQATYALQVYSGLTITTAALPSGIQGQSYSATVAATGGATPYTWSQTGLPSGLSINSSTGVISGTPTVSGSFQVTVTVRDSGASAQQTQTANYTLSIASNLTITTTSLPQGRVQIAYSATVVATGGAPPYSWSASALPPGLSINATTGAITGTPTTAGNYNTVVTVTDNVTTRIQATLPIQILGILTITYISTPGGQVGQPYSGVVQATGGVPPYNWTAIGLPAGLSISSSGAITGTPSIAGNFPVTFRVTDSSTQFPQSAQTNNISVNISPAQPPQLQITSSNLPNGMVGQLYVTQVNANGGSGAYSFTVTSGSLPPGVTMALSGQFYGTPSTPGTYNFTVTVTDANNNTATRTLSILIAPGTLAVTGTPPTTIAAGSAISVQFNGTGGIGPYKFTLSGNAPGGISLSSTGLLSGTANTPGTFTFTIIISDSQTPSATTTATFTITVTAPPIVITSNLPPGTVGLPYNGQFSATGGTGGFTWSGTAGDGLSVSSSGGVTGTPSNTGTVAVAVTVTDSSGTKATGNYSITINGPSLMVATTSLPNGALTSTYSASVNATGGTPPYTWSAAGLPAGLSIDPLTGNITGTPTALGSFSVSFTVTDSNKVTATSSIGLTITPAPLKITTTGISPVQLGQSFTVGFGATGGVTPYTWSATGLPTGVTISTTTGTLGGTPTQQGTFPIVVTVTDANNTSVSEPLNLVVSLPPAPGLTFTGLPATGASGTQETSPVTFTNTYPVDVTITLTLTFTPLSGSDDPNIQFSTGGRTTTVTVKAGSTVSLNTISVQTGTVAGTITITAALNASGTDITPSPAPVRTIVIPAAPPTISSMTETSSGSTFTLVVVGFDPTRSITQLTFTFTPASGSTLQTSTVTVSAASLFNAWWQSSQSVQYGGQFSFTIPFTVSGSLSGVASVSVTATNPTGSSNSVTTAVH